MDKDGDIGFIFKIEKGGKYANRLEGAYCKHS